MLEASNKLNLLLLLLVVASRVESANWEIEFCLEYYDNPLPPRSGTSSSSRRRLSDTDGDQPSVGSTRTGCRTCKKGWFAGPKGKEHDHKWYYVCYSCPRECESCSYYSSGYSTCTACSPDFKMYPPISQAYSGRRVCNLCPDNCEECSDQFTCKICSNGFYKDQYHARWKNDICRKCMSNCSKCFSGGKCEVCEDGYKYNAETNKCESENGYLPYLILIGIIAVILIIICVAKVCFKKGKKTDNSGNQGGNGFVENRNIVNDGFGEAPKNVYGNNQAGGYQSLGGGFQQNAKIGLGQNNYVYPVANQN